MGNLEIILNFFSCCCVWWMSFAYFVILFDCLKRVSSSRREREKDLIEFTKTGVH